MPYEKLRAELLKVREQREQHRLQSRQHRNQVLLFLSLNIPGPVKMPPGADELFGWGLREALGVLPQVDSCTQGQDLLGPWALLGTKEDAKGIKQNAVALEQVSAAGRLLDIDVYDSSGDCMRRQAHSPLQLKARLDELLAPFRP